MSSKSHIRQAIHSGPYNHGPSVIPKPGDSEYKTPAHFAGAVYYLAIEVAQGGEVLDSDAEGNEFPAPEGWYFQQWDQVKDQGVDGYFGPYDSPESMPDYVRDNFVKDKYMANLY